MDTLSTKGEHVRIILNLKEKWKATIEILKPYKHTKRKEKRI